MSQSSLVFSREQKESESVIRLGRAIIAQAFIDITRKYTRTEDLIAQEDAKRWLTNDSEELDYICNIANMSKESIMEKAKRIISLTETSCQDIP